MKQYHIQAESLEQKAEIISLFEKLGYRKWGTKDTYLKLRAHSDGDIQSVTNFSLCVHSEHLKFSELQELVFEKELQSKLEVFEAYLRGAELEYSYNSWDGVYRPLVTDMNAFKVTNCKVRVKEPKRVVVDGKSLTKKEALDYINTEY